MIYLVYSKEKGDVHMKDYKIYQVKQELTREMGFMGLGTMERMGVKVDLNNYDEVHKDVAYNDSITEILENLFSQFNTVYSEGYKGRSMSVSDIVMIDGAYYYCNPFGWLRIEL